ncbi:ABC transporter substrate-binding protein [Campylobacter mucosalis]|uniref:Tgt2/MlaC family protein n=1 Tax=Campylobacter mucosalis TaxID=202 RepID=UPI0014702312|nr:ABC transporter substrate-binding protein [Campylobacter mucosalis]
MKILKILFALCIFINMLFAVSKDEIKSVVEAKTDEAIKILTTKELSNEQKTTQLFVIFDPLFDYKQMAKISLGKKFNALTPNEQDEFGKAFEQKLKASYIDKLLSYTDQKIIIKEQTQPQPNRVFLNSELISNANKYEFVYKFYNSNDNWLIYDIEMIGVSLIQTYRSQFADMLESADFATLMKKLNETAPIKVDN